VPWPVVEFVAGQLGIADPSCVKTYGSRPMTAYDPSLAGEGPFGWCRNAVTCTDGFE
jgi:hypothetical protein